MHEFIATVACVVGLTTCPIPQPIVSSFIAKDVKTCRATVENLIAYYKYDPKKFTIKCEPK